MSRQLPLDNELIVDNFAGGGGASCGIEAALGRPVSIAVNHDPEAVAMHSINHPLARHFCEDVWQIDPRAVCKGRPVALAWFSPDCKHFSKAKGAALVDKKIRGLAWVVLRWAATVKPRVIMLENVEEFTTWGPVIDGKPCPDRKGRTFASFVRQLRGFGYAVEWKELRACDYGAPTIRKRLFMVARRDGRAIIWPTPTHGDPRKAGFRDSGLKPWHTAAECIDWSIPCPSIFARKRPLAENTLKRVAKGFRRFVIDADKPFVVQCNHGGDGFRGSDIDAPLNTFCPKDAYGIVTPYLTEHANASNPRVFPADEPLRTQCAQVKGGHFALVTPYMVGAGGPEYAGKPTSLEKPLGTLTTESHRQLVAPFIAKHYGGVVGVPADTPMPTTTTRGTQNQIVAAYVSKLRGHASRDKHGQPASEPLHTVSASGQHHALTTAYMVKYYGNEREGHDMQAPLGTVTTKDRFALVQVESSPPPLTEDQRYNAWWVMRFLEEHGVVPAIADGPRPSFFMLGSGIVWDIGMRMFSPRELFRAQGFPDEYEIGKGMFAETDAHGVTIVTARPLTKVAQVRMCGNSVSPPPAKALVRANVQGGCLFPEAPLHVHAAAGAVQKMMGGRDV